jgi:nucleoside-diphosphate-sugar epimerase
MIATVLGAGTLGTALARELHSRGLDVRVVSRGAAHHPLPDAVDHRRADLADPSGLAAAIGGSDLVLQTAQPPYPRWKQEFPALQRGVIDAAANAGARLVLADNLYMYGEGDDGVLTDSTAERPCTVKGEVRKAMADEALAAHRAGRLEVALTRPSNYVGAEYEFTRTLLLDRARAGKAMQVLGSLDQPHSFAYVPDVARAMADVALADDAYGRAWILPSLAPMTQRELCDALWAGVGREGPAKVQALRGPLMRALALVNPMLRASLEMMYEWERTFIVHARDFERRVGWGATSIADAIAGTAAGASV